jgi:hypothetical protein
MRLIATIVCLSMFLRHYQFQSLGRYQNQVDFHVTDVMTDSTKIMCQITLAVGDCAPGRAPIFDVGDEPHEAFITIEWGDDSVSSLTIKAAAKLSYENGIKIDPLSTDKLQALQIISHVYNLTQWRENKNRGGTVTSPVITCTRFGDSASIKYSDKTFNIQNMCVNSKFDWKTVNSQQPIISTDVLHKAAFYISPTIACVPFNRNVAQWDFIAVVYTNAQSIPTNGFYNHDQSNRNFVGGSTGTTCFTNVLRSETSADIRITMSRGLVPMTIITSKLNFNHTGNNRSAMKYKNGKLAGRGRNFRPPVLGAFVRNFGRISSIDGTSSNTASILLFLPQSIAAQLRNRTARVVINWSFMSSSGLTHGGGPHDILLDETFSGTITEFEIVFIQGNPTTKNSLAINVTTNFEIVESNTRGFFGDSLSIAKITVPLSKPYYTQEYVYEGWVPIQPSINNPSVFPIVGCQSKPSEASYRLGGNATIWEPILPTWIGTLSRQTMILNCKRMETGVCNVPSNEYRVLCVS